jgi:hypothetical protein
MKHKDTKKEKGEKGIRGDWGIVFFAPPAHFSFFSLSGLTPVIASCFYPPSQAIPISPFFFSLLCVFVVKNAGFGSSMGKIPFFSF